MGGYLRTHWAGRQALAWSFWINFVLLFAAIILIEPAIRPDAADRTWWSIAAAIAYLIVGHLLIYPWQVVGVLRACSRRLQGGGDSVMVTAAQGAIVVSVVAALLTMSTTLHSILATPPRPAPERALAELESRVPDYQIELLAGRSLISIDGGFDVGLTRDLETLLQREPAVQGVVLNSDGGRIYEARGVARLIRKHHLRTYVYRMCQSACTTAFIAGQERYLGEQGRLGFHQYRLLQARHPFIDPKAEEEKDRAFYQAQGIAPALLARVFATPHSSMWYPDPAELLQANVIHRLVHHKVM
jgi:hypothetical protein